MRPARKPPPGRSSASRASPAPPPSSVVREDGRPDEVWLQEWSDLLLSDPIVRAHLFLILQKPEKDAHYSVPLHVLNLLTTHPLHAHFLLEDTSHAIPLINKALHQALDRLQGSLTTPTSSNHPPLRPLTSKRAELLHCRPYYLPITHHRPSIADLRSRDTGTLISITGSVTRTQPPRVYEYAAQYQCDRCHGLFYAYADEDAENRIETPSGCEAYNQPEVNAMNGGYQRRACRSPMVHQTSQSMPRDVHMIRLQENIHRSQLTLPRSILVRLTDDQCESVKTGDVIHLSGMVRRQWGPLIIDQRVSVEPYIDAFHVSVVASSAKGEVATATGEVVVSVSEFARYWESVRSGRRELRARNHIVNALAPSLVGLFLPKLVCVLALIGGVKKEDRGDVEEVEEEEEEDDKGRAKEKGMHVRGDIHILLVGDAGVGKSVLLSSAALASPRGVLTTGTGTTTAGLTVAAVRSTGASVSSSSFTLEPGALVLADGGVCCIDEFNCVSKSDRPAVLEAMEQQTISVAKGGVVTTLSTRTSVIAALNPKGQFNHDVDLTVNTSLSSPLLSRFDVILVLLDTKNEEWDEKVAEHLLRVLPRAEGSGVKKQEEEVDEDSPINMTESMARLPTSDRLTQTQTIPITTSHRLLNQPWSMAQLQSYICHVKSRFFPTLSPSVQTLLTRYYQLQRKTGGMKQARINIRLLESLVRLSQAHARLMYRDECVLIDGVMAVIIMEYSALSCGLLVEKKGSSGWWSSAMPTTPSALHVGFSDRPEEEYEMWEAMILSKLGMRDEASGSARASDAMEVNMPSTVSFSAMFDPDREIASMPPPSSSRRVDAVSSRDSRAKPVSRDVASVPLPTPPPPPRYAADAIPPPGPLPRSSAQPSSSALPSSPSSVSFSTAAHPLPNKPSTSSSNGGAVHIPSPVPASPSPSSAAVLPRTSVAPPRSVLRTSSVASTAPTQPSAPTPSQLSRRGPSVTFAVPPTPSADPYSLLSQPSSQVRRVPSGNPFGAKSPPRSAPALPSPAPPAPASTPSAQPPWRRPPPPPAFPPAAFPRPPAVPSTTAPAPSSSPSSTPNPPSPSPHLPAPSRPAPVSPSSAPLKRAKPSPPSAVPSHSTFAPPLPHPLSNQTASPNRSVLIPPSTNAFLTPARPFPPSSSFLSPLPPLSAVTPIPTPPSLSSPLSNLSSSSSSRKENLPHFSAVTLPSSFAAAVKFTNPFTTSPSEGKTDENEDHGKWWNGVSDDVINGLDLGLG